MTNLLNSRIAELAAAPKTVAKRRRKIVFLVVEVEQRNGYYANQPLKTPVAAFISGKAKASEFVAQENREGFIRHEWEILEIPLGD